MDRLRKLYDAFNARDVDAVLDALAEDVDWPNAWEGGRLHGREAVREYWTRQWAAIDSYAHPVGFAERPDGRVAVEVDLTIDGSHAGRVAHVDEFRDGLVARMDVED
jgi:nuclear transport factor 2 (NTF2) superfamily protein